MKDKKFMTPTEELAETLKRLGIKPENITVSPSVPNDTIFIFDGSINLWEGVQPADEVSIPNASKGVKNVILRIRKLFQS